MQKSLNTATGFTLGAGMMYLLDPQRGRQRRAIFRDKALLLFRDSLHTMDVTGRDLVHRTKGVIAESRPLFKKPANPLDDILIERVRAKLGRLVSHTGAIEVHAKDGRVTLSGPVLTSEVPTLLHKISKVQGVRAVQNQLEEHSSPDDISSLQGGKPQRGGQPLDIFQTSWAPATRFLVGLSVMLPSTWLALAVSRSLGKGKIISPFQPETQRKKAA